MFRWKFWYFVAKKWKISKFLEFSEKNPVNCYVSALNCKVSGENIKMVNYCLGFVAFCGKTRQKDGLLLTGAYELQVYRNETFISSNLCTKWKWQSWWQKQTPLKLTSNFSPLRWLQKSWWICEVRVAATLWLQKWELIAIHVLR